MYEIFGQIEYCWLGSQGGSWYLSQHDLQGNREGVTGKGCWGKIRELQEISVVVMRWNKVHRSFWKKLL